MAEVSSYQALPAWWIVKTELVNTLYRVKNYLKKYRLQDGDCEDSKMRIEYYFKQFVSELISLYEMIRPILESEKDDLNVDEFMSRSNFNNKKITIPHKVTIEEENISFNLVVEIDEAPDWIEVYRKINHFMHKIGITSLKKEEDDGEEEEL